MIAARCSRLHAGATCIQIPDRLVPAQTDLLPLRGPNNNVAPRIRPTVQRLPTLDAWNVTVQRQITPTINVEIAYIGNKGTHVFAGNGPAYNTNEVAVGDGTSPYSCSRSPARLTRMLASSVAPPPSRRLHPRTTAGAFSRAACQDSSILSQIFHRQ